MKQLETVDIDWMRVLSPKQVNTVQSEWLKKTWNEYPPEWFITLKYKTLPRKIETVETYISEFHKIFRRKFHWKLKGRTTRSQNIPMFPKGIGMVHFHERSDMVNERTGKLIQPFHTHTHLSNTKGYFKNSEEVRFFINEMIHECRKKKRKNDKRQLENICYLNEEDVKIWNHSHHANYNIDNKKKKIKEYLVGRPELDIYSFDHLNTFF